MAQQPADRGVASWARDSRLGVRARLIAASLRTSLARLLGRGRVEKAAHYDAFISYSHLSDAQLAPALKQGLHAFARPWYRLRALHVFLDNTNLSANPGLWSSIEEALGRARYLILLASPPAAQSPWVGRELQEWCSDGGSGRVLLVLTAGELSWDREAGDFDWTASTAAPRALAGVFADEPRWIDLRSVEELSLRDARFADAVADVAAPLHGQPKDELTGDDVRQHRRTKRLARGAVLLLLALAAAATVGAFVAVDQRDRAEEQLRVATSRFLGAEAVASATRQHSQSLLLGVEALDASDTSEARDSLYRSLMRLPEAVRYLQPRRGQPIDTAYTADGRRLLVATSGGAIEIRSAATGEALRVVRLSRTPVIDVDAAPDRRQAVAVDGEGRLRLFDPRTGSLRDPLPIPPGLDRAHTVDFGQRRAHGFGAPEWARAHLGQRERRGRRPSGEQALPWHHGCRARFPQHQTRHRWLGQRGHPVLTIPFAGALAPPHTCRRERLCGCAQPGRRACRGRVSGRRRHALAGRRWRRDPERGRPRGLRQYARLQRRRRPAGLGLSRLQSAPLGRVHRAVGAPAPDRPHLIRPGRQLRSQGPDARQLGRGWPRRRLEPGPARPAGAAGRRRGLAPRDQGCGQPGRRRTGVGRGERERHRERRARHRPPAAAGSRALGARSFLQPGRPAARSGDLKRVPGPPPRAGMAGGYPPGHSARRFAHRTLRWTISPSTRAVRAWPPARAR